MIPGESRLASTVVGPAPSAMRSGRPHIDRLLLVTGLAATDIAALLIAFRLAFWIRFDMHITVAPEVIGRAQDYNGLALWLIPLWLATFAAFGLYSARAKVGGLRETADAFHACTIASMLVVAATFFGPSLIISRVWLLCVWGFSFLLTAVGRLLAGHAVVVARRRGHLLSRAVIVGTNAEALHLAPLLDDASVSGVTPLGFVATSQTSLDLARGTTSALTVLGSVQEVTTIVRQYGVEDVVIAITSLSREELLDASEQLSALPVRVGLSSGVYELLTTRADVRTLGTVPVISLHKHRLHPVEQLLKTLLEVTLTAMGCALLLPLFAAIALWVKLESPGPILHRRRVLGAAGRPFDAFKFRTMHVDGHIALDADRAATQLLQLHHKLRRDPRVTSAGRVLRRFSLDELPQLLNVLRGEMSLVGPRMITQEEVEKYGRQRLNLLAVKPGMTGLWQVSGRSDLTYAERVRIDMFYVRNYSIWLDLKILFVDTLPAVIKGRGAY